MNIVDFRKKHKHLNCSETMLYYGNEYYQLNLNQHALKSMSGFGGGMFEEDLCGVVSGGISVISMVLTNKTAYESDQLSLAVITYKKRIKDAFHSITCSPIKAKFRDEELGCDNVIIKALKIMVDTIDSFK
ncbi:C-GCAxxG-C-C family protein [Mycoplasmatota bacterium]|nr:C-GCAxxG-C-C family protein [Mycoplasmatota bacterium]